MIHGLDEDDDDNDDEDEDDDDDGIVYDVNGIRVIVAVSVAVKGTSSPVTSTELNSAYQKLVPGTLTIVSACWPPRSTLTIGAADVP